jgi:hypothetical protein
MIQKINSVCLISEICDIENCIINIILQRNQQQLFNLTNNQVSSDDNTQIKFLINTIKANNKINSLITKI